MADYKSPQKASPVVTPPTEMAPATPSAAVDTSNAAQQESLKDAIGASAASPEPTAEFGSLLDPTDEVAIESGFASDPASTIGTPSAANGGPVAVPPPLPDTEAPERAADDTEMESAFLGDPAARGVASPPAEPPSSFEDAAASAILGAPAGASPPAVEPRRALNGAVVRDANGSPKAATPDGVDVETTPGGFSLTPPDKNSGVPTGVKLNGPTTTTTTKKNGSTTTDTATSSTQLDTSGLKLTDYMESVKATEDAEATRKAVRDALNLRTNEYGRRTLELQDSLDRATSDRQQLYTQKRAELPLATPDELRVAVDSSPEAAMLDRQIEVLDGQVKSFGARHSEMRAAVDTVAVDNMEEIAKKYDLPVEIQVQTVKVSSARERTLDWSVTDDGRLGLRTDEKLRSTAEEGENADVTGQTGIVAGNGKLGFFHENTTKRLDNDGNVVGTDVDGVSGGLAMMGDKVGAGADLNSTQDHGSFVTQEKGSVQASGDGVAAQGEASAATAAKPALDGKDGTVGRFEPVGQAKVLLGGAITIQKSEDKVTGQIRMDTQIKVNVGGSFATSMGGSAAGGVDSASGKVGVDVAVSAAGSLKYSHLLSPEEAVRYSEGMEQAATGIPIVGFEHYPDVELATKLGVMGDPSHLVDTMNADSASTLPAGDSVESTVDVSVAGHVFGDTSGFSDGDGMGIGGRVGGELSGQRKVKVEKKTRPDGVEVVWVTVAVTEKKAPDASGNVQGMGVTGSASFGASWSVGESITVELDPNAADYATQYNYITSCIRESDVAAIRATGGFTEIGFEDSYTNVDKYGAGTGFAQGGASAGWNYAAGSEEHRTLGVDPNTGQTYYDGSGQQTSELAVNLQGVDIAKSASKGGATGTIKNGVTRLNLGSETTSIAPGTDAAPTVGSAMTATPKQLISEVLTKRQVVTRTFELSSTDMFRLAERAGDRAAWSAAAGGFVVGYAPWMVLRSELLNLTPDTELAEKDASSASEVAALDAFIKFGANAGDDARPIVENLAYKTSGKGEALNVGFRFEWPAALQPQREQFESIRDQFAETQVSGGDDVVVSQALGDLAIRAGHVRDAIDQCADIEGSGVKISMLDAVTQLRDEILAKVPNDDFRDLNPDEQPFLDELRATQQRVEFLLPRYKAEETRHIEAMKARWSELTWSLQSTEHDELLRDTAEALKRLWPDWIDSILELRAAYIGLTEAGVQVGRVVSMTPTARRNLALEPDPDAYADAHRELTDAPLATNLEPYRQYPQGAS